MKLTVLGSSAGWPHAGAAASGYLLQHDGFNVCLDLGTGTFAALQQHIDLGDVHGVVISHPHWDHFLDLYPMFVARYWDERGLPRIPVVAPTGFFDFLLRLSNSDEGREHMRKVFEPREVEPGSPYELGPFRAETALLPHWVEDMGSRVSADDTTIAFTGDTGPADALVGLAKEADLFIAEASWQEKPEGVDPLHLTAHQAGEHAARAGAARLLLTHFWQGLDRDRSRDQAAAAFDGEIVIGREGLELEVGR